jgi:hypothetical protein
LCLGDITVYSSVYVRTRIASSAMLIWECCGRNVEGQSTLKTDVSGPGPRRVEWQSVRYLGYEEYV